VKSLKYKLDNFRFPKLDWNILLQIVIFALFHDTRTTCLKFRHNSVSFWGCSMNSEAWIPTTHFKTISFMLWFPVWPPSEHVIYEFSFKRNMCWSSHLDSFSLNEHHLILKFFLCFSWMFPLFTVLES
jgi:hypothetical protein